jgi:Fe-S cluster assembly iron-binding protein IscA
MFHVYPNNACDSSGDAFRGRTTAILAPLPSTSRGNLRLVLTKQAVDVIQTLTTGTEAPDAVGLRIASTNDGPERFKVSAASNPERGDQLVESEGARVYLEPEAAIALEDKILDAQVDDQGTVQFMLDTQ